MDRQREPVARCWIVAASVRDGRRSAGRALLRVEPSRVELYLRRRLSRTGDARIKLGSGWRTAIARERRDTTPPIFKDERSELHAVEPSQPLQPRTRRELGNAADAEASHRHDGIGNLEDGAEIARVDDAHPAHANAFGTRREP